MGKKSPVMTALVDEYDPKNSMHTSAALFNQIKVVISDLYALQIFDIPKSQIISEKIAIHQNGEEILESPDQILELSEAWIKAKLALQARLSNNSPNLINATYDIVIAFLKPNLIYQKETTEKRQAEAIAKVPLSKGVVLENEKIVDANMRITRKSTRKSNRWPKKEPARLIFMATGAAACRSLVIR
jgi:membrane-associated HD superfamily phosphohydrolase